MISQDNCPICGALLKPEKFDRDVCRNTSSITSNSLYHYVKAIYGSYISYGNLCFILHNDPGTTRVEKYDGELWHPLLTFPYLITDWSNPEKHVKRVNNLMALL